MSDEIFRQRIDLSRYSERSHPFLGQLARLYETGPRSEDIFSVHGGPAEAVLHLARTGHFPTGGTFSREFHFLRVDQDSMPGFLGRMTVAADYANWNAVQYWLLDALRKSYKFRPKNIADFKFIIHKDDEIAMAEFFRESQPHGLTEEAFYQLVRIGEQDRKGVIFFLSKKVAQDFRMEGTGIEDERKIIVPKRGLSIDYVTGIDPLGPHEQRVLEKIKRSATP